jgi:Secreted protein containing C-terminal beta-propeller domain distantly related to WD-40 repeats
VKIQFKLFLILILAITGTFFISGSLALGLEPDNFDDIGMTSFKSEDEMKAFFEKSSSFGSPSYLDYNGTNGYDMPTDVSAFSIYSGDEYYSYYDYYGYSTRNIQIADINEAGIVKTNGKVIFYSPEQSYIRNITYHTEEQYPYYESYDYDNYQMTFIINALPAKTASIISNITETGGSLYLFDNVLLTIGYKDNSFFVEAYDITDPAFPRQMWIQKYDGSYSDSRLIDGKLYLVTRKSFDTLPISYMGKNISYDDCYYPYGPSLIMPAVELTYFVSEVDVQTGDFTNTIALLGSYNSTLFITDDNVYMTNHYYPDSQRLYLNFIESNGSDYLPSDIMQYFKKVMKYDLSDHAKYVAIDGAVGNYVRSSTKEEASEFLTAFYEDYNPYFLDLVEKNEKTAIAKINLETFDVTSGFVPGRLNDQSLIGRTYGYVPDGMNQQFSMDEADGYLRVVSTIGSNWMTEESKSKTMVSVLDKDMTVVGDFEELAVGGEVQSIRYTGNKLYMETYDIGFYDNYDNGPYYHDPLFVIDLSAPETPVLLGDLKLTEYHDYLYPINDTLLVGLGSTEGWSWHSKLSLYDVSDPANPIELDTFSFKLNEYLYIYDDVFTWNAEKGLMTVSGGEYNYVFEIKDEGINLLVKDRHNWASGQSVVYIDDYVYFFSDQEIHIYDQNDKNIWKRIKVIPIPQPEYPIYVY